jgi:predicted DNA-binding protein (MmcQ/YjbR family)
MRKICLALPDTSEGLQFGQTVWRAGKKVFAQAHCHDERWQVSFWVGVHAQLLMTDDSRYTIPPYMGHNGWIALDVSKKHSERELQPLALESYRHFALKKMLAKLSRSDGFLTRRKRCAKFSHGPVHDTQATKATLTGGVARVRRRDRIQQPTSLANSPRNPRQRRGSNRASPVIHRRSSTMAYFSSDSEIDRIGRGLLDRSLPKAEWTHSGHFAAAVWVLRRPDMDAARDMPGLIRAYNEATGVITQTPRAITKPSPWPPCARRARGSSGDLTCRCMRR